MPDITPTPADQPTAGQLAQLACVLEVLAPKPGNVQPGKGFDDMTWEDFVVSASVIRSVLDQSVCRQQADRPGVGDLVLRCIQATRAAVSVNTNLGIVLLLAPLCLAPHDRPLEQGVADVLKRMGPGDADKVYQAIRLANPGGLGQVASGDVHAAPPVDLVQAMRLAADRDAVARQYVNGFADVFRLADRLAACMSPPAEPGAAPVAKLDQAIVRTYLEQLAREPDSLIVRKLGPAAAAKVQAQAAAVLKAGYPHTPASHTRLTAFDDDLRNWDNQANPGTTADLLTAALWVALKRGQIVLPARWAASLADVP